MADAAYGYYETKTRNNIIQFPKNFSYTTNSMNDVPVSVQDVSFPELVKMIEGVIYNMVTRGELLGSRPENTSFDPVYICDLKPDSINPRQTDQLKSLASRIVDKSDEIFFDDGMDD
jgi:hypothetical protein